MSDQIERIFQYDLTGARLGNKTQQEKVWAFVTRPNVAAAGIVGQFTIVAHFLTNLAQQVGVGKIMPQLLTPVETGIVVVSVAFVAALAPFVTRGLARVDRWLTCEDTRVEQDLQKAVIEKERPLNRRAFDDVAMFSKKMRYHAALFLFGGVLACASPTTTTTGILVAAPLMAQMGWQAYSMHRVAKGKWRFATPRCGA